MIQRIEIDFSESEAQPAAFVLTLAKGQLPVRGQHLSEPGRGAIPLVRRRPAAWAAPATGLPLARTTTLASRP